MNYKIIIGVVVVIYIIIFYINRKKQFYYNNTVKGVMEYYEAFNEGSNLTPTHYDFKFTDEKNMVITITDFTGVVKNIINTTYDDKSPSILIINTNTSCGDVYCETLPWTMEFLSSSKVKKTINNNTNTVLTYIGDIGNI